MKRETILNIKVTNKDFNIQYTGSIAEPPTSKDKLKHDERLMTMLISNRKVFDFFFRLVEPARRYYLREARKKRKSLEALKSVQDKTCI